MCRLGSNPRSTNRANRLDPLLQLFRLFDPSLGSPLRLTADLQLAVRVDFEMPLKEAWDRGVTGITHRLSR